MKSVPPNACFVDGCAWLDYGAWWDQYHPRRPGQPFKKGRIEWKHWQFNLFA